MQDHCLHFLNLIEQFNSSVSLTHQLWITLSVDSLANPSNFSFRSFTSFIRFSTFCSTSFQACSPLRSKHACGWMWGARGDGWLSVAWPCTTSPSLASAGAAEEPSGQHWKIQESCWSTTEQCIAEDWARVIQRWRGSWGGRPLASSPEAAVWDWMLWTLSINFLLF